MSVANGSGHQILTKEKLLNILKKVTGTEEVKVVISNVRPERDDDEDTSEILSVDIEAKVKDEVREFCWTAKVSVNHLDNHLFIRGLRMEENEVNFFREIVPAWHKIINERKADIKLGFSNCLYTEFHQDPAKGSLIVTENLQQNGFQEPVGKKDGLSLAHVKLVMEELAKLHALGFIHFKSYPGGITEGIKMNEVVATGWAFKERELEDVYMEAKNDLTSDVKKNIANVLAAVQEQGQDFVAAYQRFDEEHCAEDFLSDLNTFDNTDTFKTLTHGDLWFNNMLFR